MDRNLTVVILAAGLGTRMKSKKAKVLHRAGGRYLAEHVVRTALRLTSPENITVVVGHQADRVEDILKPYGVSFVKQERQLGTGHALMVCRDALSARTGHLLVLYGDCPLVSMETLQTLIERHKQSSSAATVLTTFLDDPTGYGRIIRDWRGCLVAIVEQRAASEEQRRIQEINSGMYCYCSEAIWKHIDEIRPDNLANEYYLTDLIGLFHAAGYPIDTAVAPDSAEVLGINNRMELARVDRIFRQRKINQLMEDGVTVELPETVLVDDDVEVGPDSILEPFVRLMGKSRIGEDCVVGACSVVRDSTVGNRVEIGPFSVIGWSTIEDDVRIGPYARLRVSNTVKRGAHIGNFVELKNTVLGSEAKAMHLAYLGDSIIGENVNVGAGTITCNYDGRKKHQTKIGDRAFIGSNATLVAPVQVGDDSYVAAGSVITDPVPSDALALGRARQVVKEDWIKKRNSKKA